tara:strand:- start:475 stop:1218 length:744 start_codon:yes stop_codon:yes gene_type:complete
MIESTDNKKIKHVKRLNSSTKYRNKTKQFVLENKHSVTDILINHPESVDYLIVTKQQIAIKELAAKNNITTFLCSENCCKFMASVKESGGCFAVINQPNNQYNITKHSLAVALYNIKSPVNCGAIIRNAHAFGCDCIYLIGHCCDPYHPESVRSAAGNIMSIPLIEKETLASLSKYKVWKLDIHASAPLNAIHKEDKICFLLGSEAGFDEHNDYKKMTPCYIPMRNGIDSLNVAATSAIVLYYYTNL